MCLYVSVNDLCVCVCVNIFGEAVVDEDRQDKEETNAVVDDKVVKIKLTDTQLNSLSLLVTAVFC